MERRNRDKESRLLEAKSTDQRCFVPVHDNIASCQHLLSCSISQGMTFYEKKSGQHDWRLTEEQQVHDLLLHCCLFVQVNEAADFIYEQVDPEANLIFGAVIDPTMQSDVSITLIATGVGGNQSPGSSYEQQPITRQQRPAMAASQGPPASNNGPAAQQQGPQVVIQRPTSSNPKVRTDVPTGGVEIPAFLRRMSKK